MTTHEGWVDYLRRITPGLTRKDIAHAAGIDVSGVSRWLNGTSRPSPEKVIDFARGIGKPPIEALIAAGYLEDGDVNGQVELVQSVDELPDEMLVDELRGRLLDRRGDQSQHGGSLSPPAWKPREEPRVGRHKDAVERHDLGSA